jgi:hypothetical protein
MSKINNKLILILTILAFVFGLSLATPAYARQNGVIPFDYYATTGGEMPIYSTGSIYTTPAYNTVPVFTNVYTRPVYSTVYNNPTVIEGCGNRNTGFSTTNGQSCVGNYVIPVSTTTNTTTNTTVSKTTDTTKKVATGSDINPTYGSLTANALFGSNSFMPTGLIQWIFFVLLILAIIFLWRYVHFSKEKYMSEPMKHA